MKAKLFDPKRLEFPCILEKKYDGVRLRALTDGKNNVILKTYNNMLVDLPALAKEVQELDRPSTVLDAEITYGEGKLKGRSSISGAVNSAIHGGTVDESNMVFNVLDILSRAEWDSLICTERHMARLQNILSLEHTRYIQPTQFTIVHTLQEIHDMYNGLLEKGFEGVVIKKFNHYYSYKRNWDWMKMKANDPADLVCVGYKPGKPGTKYETMIGSLLCTGFVTDSKDRQFEVNVAVGSGMSDIDRGLDPNYYIGSTIAIKYNSIVQDTITGGYSLFLPIFKERRFDK